MPTPLHPSTPSQVNVVGNMGEVKQRGDNSPKNTLLPLLAEMNSHREACRHRCRHLYLSNTQVQTWDHRNLSLINAHRRLMDAPILTVRKS